MSKGTPAMTDKETLKPCPFCGGEAAYGAGQDGPFVNCTDCLASTNTLIPQGQTVEEAIAAWNTRPTPPIPDDVLKKGGDALTDALVPAMNASLLDGADVDCHALFETALAASGLLDKNKALVDALGRVEKIADDMTADRNVDLASPSERGPLNALLAVLRISRQALKQGGSDE